MLILNTESCRVNPHKGRCFFMRRGNNPGLYFAAFGAGLLTATLCPLKLMLVIAAAALVLMGLALVRNC